ncbi:uncharacterized protein LOC116024111 [Ipomoea triloba]|uniref:uncharacterized protein LOC116024111 n=1 Tax=Ipomoea triloba TaxID=35885 RepID=UPI00125E63CC|nr:uncharacterized protein LOC116024111 [Ipomoea triloba]
MEFPREGLSNNRPPALSGTNYSYWKARMKIYILAQGERVWRVVENELKHPLDDNNKAKGRADWSEEELKEFDYNSKAMNAIYGAVSEETFKLIAATNVAKTTWDILCDHHEGNSTVKQSKLQMVQTQFENLKMEKEEDITQFNGRILEIAGEAYNLGEPIPENRNKNKSFSNNQGSPSFAQNQSVNSKKKGNPNLDGIQCYECKGYGHIQLECPNYLRRKNKTYVTTLSDDSDSEEENNTNFVAFFTNHEGDDESKEDMQDLLNSYKKSSKILMEFPREGLSNNRPPALSGTNYSYWKARMKIYILAQGERVWRVVENELKHPLDDNNKAKGRADWSEEELKEFDYNSKAMNAIYGAVSEETFKLIAATNVAKTTWDILCDHHEGNSTVKQSKLQMVQTQFENLKMEKEEDITQFNGRILEIAGEAYNLGEPIPENRNKNKSFSNNQGSPSFAQNQSVNSKKKGNPNLDGIQCYECKGYGHIQLECPNYLRRKNKTYVTTLSDDSDSEEENNTNFVAFFTNHEGDDESKEDMQDLLNSYKKSSK